MLFTAPPAQFSPQAEVVAVLPFLPDEKVLLLQRLPSHPQANLWCAPGGKIQPGEIPSEAAVRELWEETGIESAAENLLYLGKYFVRYPNGDFIFHLFKTHLSTEELHIKISKNEHQTYMLCPLDKLAELPLTPGLDECFQMANL